MQEQFLESPSHAYYITTVVYDRLSVFTRPSTIIPLFDSLNYYRAQLHMRVLGYVVMPDHMHLLLWPRQKDDMETFMRSLKTYTAKRIVRQAEAEQRRDWLTAFARAGKETGRSTHKVWQDDFWEVVVVSDRFVRQKLNYIHRNPVRRGLVRAPEEYVYSSYRSYVYDEEWLIELDRGWS